MTFEEIKALIHLVNKSDLAEFVFEDGEQRVVIRTSKYSKSVKGAAPVAHTYMTQPAMQAAATAPMQAAATQPTNAVDHFVEKKETSSQATPPPAAELPLPVSNLVPIKSPMVGTFYRSSSPDKPALAKIGDNVSVGSPVCIIEAMKLFNEIESEVKGKIVKVLVDDASPVEYDQILFMVDPAG